MPKLFNHAWRWSENDKNSRILWKSISYVSRPSGLVASETNITTITNNTLTANIKIFKFLRLAINDNDAKED